MIEEPFDNVSIESLYVISFFLRTTPSTVIFADKAGKGVAHHYKHIMSVEKTREDLCVLE